MIREYPSDVRSLARVSKALIATTVVVVVGLSVLTTNQTLLAAAYTVIKVTDGGQVTGVVKFESKYPKQRRVRVDKNNDACGT